MERARGCSPRARRLPACIARSGAVVYSDVFRHFAPGTPWESRRVVPPQREECDPAQGRVTRPTCVGTSLKERAVSIAARSAISVAVAKRYTQHERNRSAAQIPYRSHLHRHRRAPRSWWSLRRLPSDRPGNPARGASCECTLGGVFRTDPDERGSFTRPRHRLCCRHSQTASRCLGGQLDRSRAPHKSPLRTLAGPGSRHPRGMAETSSPGRAGPDRGLRGLRTHPTPPGP
jgi:hypothetical protein